MHATHRKIKHRGAPLTVALGRKSADPERYRRMITLHPRVSAIPIPLTADHLTLVKKWMLGGNNKYGTCGPTALANFIVMQYKYLLGEDITVTDAAIFDLYKRSGNPNFPQQDDGVDMTVMLDAFLKGGLDITHADGRVENIKPLCYAKVMLDVGTQRSITGVFGTVIWGVDLDVAQDAQTDAGKWDYVRGSPIWGGHAVPGGSYTSKSGAGQIDESIITWTLKVGTTDLFVQYQLAEAYVVVLSALWTNPAFIAGMDQAALAKEYEDKTGRPFPAPVPPPPPPPTTGTIHGTVADGESGVPIANAVVMVGNGSDTARATTDAKGSYRITVDVLGTRPIHCEAEGYAPVTGTVTVEAGADLQVDIDLAKVVPPPQPEPTPAGQEALALTKLAMQAYIGGASLGQAAQDTITLYDEIRARLAAGSKKERR